MENINVLKPTTYSGQNIGNKIRHFIAAWLLAELVLIEPIYHFFEDLNTKGILGLGDNFSSWQSYWGDGIGLNILKTIIIISMAGVFGFLYGYLSKRVSMSEKIIVNTINCLLGVFFFVFVLIIIILITGQTSSNEIDEGISFVLSFFSNSPLYLSFLVLQLVGSFIAGFLMIGIGMKVINSPYHNMDKARQGTLFDISWYHYLWLWLPISLYGQLLLNLIYLSGHTLITFVRNVRWYEFLGASVSSEGNNEKNSIDIAWGKLIIIAIAVSISFNLLVYLKEVLSGEKRIHWALKVLSVVGIGIVIPFAMLFFSYFISP